MINYAPLEEEKPPSPQVQKNINEKTSECNTFVMIFIGGVLLLALMDTVH